MDEECEPSSLPLVIIYGLNSSFSLDPIIHESH